jgi:uncharacterized membrane protein (UPF0127 family)
MMKIAVTVAAFLFCAIGAIGQPKMQPKFEKKEIKVGKHKLNVEIADTEEKLSFGLMFRQNLPDGTGMLFIFPDEQPRSFWMKNTFVALSIAYINAQKKIVDIQDMVPVKSEMETPQTYPSAGSAMYALEVPRGWFKKKKIKIGDKIEL